MYPSNHHIGQPQSSHPNQAPFHGAPNPAISSMALGHGQQPPYQHNPHMNWPVQHPQQPQSRPQQFVPNQPFSYGAPPASHMQYPVAAPPSQPMQAPVTSQQWTNYSPNPVQPVPSVQPQPTAVTHPASHAARPNLTTEERHAQKHEEKLKRRAEKLAQLESKLAQKQERLETKAKRRTARAQRHAERTKEREEKKKMVAEISALVEQLQSKTHSAQKQQHIDQLLATIAVDSSDLSTSSSGSDDSDSSDSDDEIWLYEELLRRHTATVAATAAPAPGSSNTPFQLPTWLTLRPLDARAQPRQSPQSSPQGVAQGTQERTSAHNSIEAAKAAADSLYHQFAQYFPSPESFQQFMLTMLARLRAGARTVRDDVKKGFYDGVESIQSFDAQYVVPATQRVQKSIQDQQVEFDKLIKSTQVAIKKNFGGNGQTASPVVAPTTTTTTPTPPFGSQKPEEATAVPRYQTVGNGNGAAAPQMPPDVMVQFLDALRTAFDLSVPVATRAVAGVADAANRAIGSKAPQQQQQQRQAPPTTTSTSTTPTTTTTTTTTPVAICTASAPLTTTIAAVPASVPTQGPLSSSHSNPTNLNSSTGSVVPQFDQLDEFEFTDYMLRQLEREMGQTLTAEHVAETSIAPAAPTTSTASASSVVAAPVAAPAPATIVGDIVDETPATTSATVTPLNRSHGDSVEWDLISDVLPQQQRQSQQQQQQQQQGHQHAGHFYTELDRDPIVSVVPIPGMPAAAPAPAPVHAPETASAPSISESVVHTTTNMASSPVTESASAPTPTHSTTAPSASAASSAASIELQLESLFAHSDELNKQRQHIMTTYKRLEAEGKGPADGRLRLLNEHLRKIDAMIAQAQTSIQILIGDSEFDAELNQLGLLMNQ